MLQASPPLTHLVLLCCLLVACGETTTSDEQPGFLHARTIAIDLKVTYKDDGTAPIVVEYTTATGRGLATVATRTDSGAWKTSTVRLADATFDDTLPAGHDFRLSSPSEPLEVRFVRIIKVEGL